MTSLKDEREKYRILKKLNYLIMKFNTLRRASANFDVPQQYVEKVVERMEPMSSKCKKEQ